MVKNFFKFLEGKGKEIPFKLKFTHFPEEIKPEDLNVTGDLDLSWLPIKTLPEVLNVGGFLNLNHCTSLVSLPEVLNVGGDLYVDEKLLGKYGGKDNVRKFIEDNGGYVKGRIIL